MLCIKAIYTEQIAKFDQKIKFRYFVTLENIILEQVYIRDIRNIIMFREYPRRRGWWISELESLGLSVKKTNEFNDLNEVSSLAEIIKQRFYQVYKADN